MKKLLLLLLFIPIVLGCSKDSNEPDIPEQIFRLTVVNPYERGQIQQITLPGYVFELNNPSYTTVVLNEGMPSGLNNVRVTITYLCNIFAQTINRDVYVNFLEDMPNVTLDITSFSNCTANISISYN